MVGALTQKHCIPCEGGTPPLEEKTVVELLTQVQGWSADRNKQITKDFKFKNFVEALQFVNQVGKIAESEGHHPDISLHNWRYVKITLATHAIGGLSENDFILASKVDKL